MEKFEELMNNSSPDKVIEAAEAGSYNTAFLQHIFDDLSENGVQSSAFKEAMNQIGLVAQSQSPLDQFEIVPLIPMNIGNFYFSFTNPSLFMLLTLSFFLLLILVFVLWILVRALWHFPLSVIHHMMVNPKNAPASSSSSSSNKRKDKRKAKEDLLRNLVVKEVEGYLDKYKENLLTEFPRSHPYIETTEFLSKVTSQLLEDAGLPNTADPAMQLLNSVHNNLVADFRLVDSYTNNPLYSCIRFFLKDYR